MGNCRSCKSSDTTDAAWKKQTRGSVENKLYSFVDLKGENSDALLVKAFKDGGEDGLRRVLRDQLLYSYLYNGGEGKVITKEDFLKWKTDCGEITEENQEQVHAMEYPPSTACWSLTDRGTLGETALHLCFLNNKPHLHRKIAHVLLQEYPAMAMDKYEGEEYFGETCLHIAIVNGDIESVRLLVEQYGADVHAAASGKFFLPEDSKEKIRIDSNFIGYAYYGEYPAAFAACFDENEMYDILVRRGADPNKKDSFGNTVLHLCVISNKMEMYAYAVHRKHKIRADISIENEAGLTPLALAAQLGRHEMFQPMLELGSMLFWSFGHVICSAYPLEGLDSISENGKSDPNSALLITLHGKSDEHLNMLNTGIMYRLLEEKWMAFGRRKFYTRMLFAVLYLIAFSLAIYLRPRDLKMKNIKSNLDRLRITMEAITVLGSIIYIVLEVKDVLISQGIAAQLRSVREAPGKTIFLGSCVLVVFALPFRYLDLLIVETHLLIIAAPMAWCYLLFFCRGFTAIGPFIDMVYKMCAGDMSRFFIIFVIFLTGATQSFSHVMKGLPNYQHEGDTFLVLLHWTFGDFDYFELEQSKYPTMAKFLFFYFMLFVTVLLLNMLIAMMTNTYQNIADRSEKEWRRQWAEIIMVLERSVTPTELMRIQDDYSVNMAADGSCNRARGIMVIKKSEKRSKADVRKAAVLNWQILGKESNKTQLRQQAFA